MSATSTMWELTGHTVPVTRLDALWWPEDRLTKGDVLAYYRDIAPVLLPHLAGRPVTLRIFPDGIHGPGYYRRARPDDAPAWLQSADYQAASTGHVLHVVLVDDAAGLIWLANAGSLEFHTWSSRLPDLTEADVAVFDLDPGEQASFDDVRRAAMKLHIMLQELGLRSYAKTSGHQGMHVYVPLAPGHAFGTVRTWVRALADRLAAADPDLIAVAHGRTHQGRQVTIDHAQNSVGRNTAAPYTLRAVPGAPVSAPVTWDEVEAGRLHPADLTLRTMRARIANVGDLFAPVLLEGQHLPG